MKLSNQSLQKLTAFSCILLLALALGACTGDEDPENDNLLNFSNTNNQDSDTDTGTEDTDTEEDTDPVDPCDEVECGDHEMCIDGECEAIADAGYWCDEPEDLGELTVGQDLSITADATGQPDTDKTSCSALDNESGNAVFQFTVDEPMDVSIDLVDSSAQLVMEVRESLCDDPEAIHQNFGCRDMYDEGVSVIDAAPDTTYYIIIEARHDSEPGEFTLDFEMESLVCAPKDDWYCEGDNLRVNCWTGTEERAYECGSTGCANDECGGDGCHNAYEVTGPMTVTGDMSAYTNRFDFFPHPECSSDTNGTEGPRTSGQDLVFSFPGLEEGQQVVVDTLEDATTNYFGVVENCDETNIQCIHGESHQQVMEWTVPEDGDFYVIVNQNPATSDSFEYQIDILD